MRVLDVAAGKSYHVLEDVLGVEDQLQGQHSVLEYPPPPQRGCTNMPAESQEAELLTWEKVVKLLFC